MARQRHRFLREAHRGRCLSLARLQNPVTGTVVSVEGDLEERYRARGWSEPDTQTREPLAAPEEPVDAPPPEKPATRRTARRKP